MAQTKKKLSITPLADRVVVQPTSREEQTASGIIIPTSSKEERPERGTVVAVGPGKWNEDGDGRIPMSVKAGDTVLFSTYQDPREIDGEKYYILDESSIQAIID